MLSAHQISRGVRDGRLSAVGVLEESLQAIASRDDTLHAFLEIDADHARSRAEHVDAEVARRAPVGPLAGVPVALKDNICTAWGRTTCASRILRGYQSPFDAHVVEQLEDAGAVIVGKANLDEFAMGSSTENSAAAPTLNPWCNERVPGGSSGGPAVAVAAGMVPLALGSDTGGSIRQPAAFCNVTGLKPSYGRVSRYGLVAFGSSLDQIGPIARDVADAALLLSVVAGHDERDSTSVERPPDDCLSRLNEPLGAVRLGIAAEYFSEGLDAEVGNIVRQAIETFAAHGAEVQNVHLPHAEYAVACYYLICTAEASSNLARFDGVHYGYRAPNPADITDLCSRSRAEGFGTEVKRRIMLGTYALSSGYYDQYYLKALKVRRLLKEDYDQAFRKVDVIASPTSPVPAFPLGERLEDPLAMYLADTYTVSANLAGLCAISIPCGFTANGLPVGLQLQAPAFAEDHLLQVAHAYQQWTDWHTREPPSAGR